jgi:hypothetical protein
MTSYIKKEGLSPNPHQNYHKPTAEHILMPYALTIEMLIFLLKAFHKFLSVFEGHLVSTNMPSIVEKSTNLRSTP